MKNFDYNTFISRNWIYIDSNLQKKIKKTSILFAGCGLGSVISEVAVRMGFTNITIADGDEVNISNLNRQSYILDDLNYNKAKRLKKRLININSNANIRVINKYINEKILKSLIKKHDFVVNTVDLNKIYFSVISNFIKNDKTVLCPFNLGFRGLLLLFNKHSASPESIWGNHIPKNDHEFYIKLFKSLEEYSLPFLKNKNINSIFQEIKKRGYYPQICIGSYIVASITLTAIIKLIQGVKINFAPVPIFFDAYTNK
ncbi:MAG: ThiF family adenylyltransferase [Patescibacteria group bacterium]|nr:ThiF family adenylyltransferase [Patescibacteria group bacterium]